MIQGGQGKTTRLIPVHEIAKCYGQDFCSILPALHHLTGADYTSKVGTKYSALQAKPVNYLKNFGQGIIIIVKI